MGVIYGRNRPWDTLCSLQCFEEKDCHNKIFADSSEENRESYPSSERTGHTHVSDRWCGGRFREDAMDGDDAGRREVLGDITNTIGDKDALEPVVIDLESSLFPEEFETIMALVHLRIDNKREDLRLEIPKLGDMTDYVKKEIRGYGLGVEDLHRIENSEGAPRFVCLNAEDGNIACCVAVDGSDEVVWIPNLQQLDDGIAMRLLYQSGYTRAFVSNIVKSKHGGWIVSFHKGGFGEMERKSVKHRPDPVFPKLRVRSQSRISDKVRWKTGAAGACRLNVDVNPAVMELFFESGVGVLRRDFEFLELPIWMEAEMRIAEDTNLAKYHHLKIYVDGSSDPRERLSHPLEAESFGIVDSWAFVVVGVDSDDHEYMIGWSGHTVCYMEDDPHYIGARCMCPASAEREALFWAGLWRMSLNSDISTYFCFDSTTAGNFASGQSGTGELTLQHMLLRGLFQCLETALGADGMAMVHVYGHCGILWNEFVDTAAKYAGRHALYTPRQAVDMTLWRHRIPYLWMIFASDAGLPPLHQDGFKIEPPKLPEMRKRQDVAMEAGSEHYVMVKISAASLNVRTLLEGSKQDGGKAAYLMQQFKDLHFNFVGVQEARTGEGVSRDGNGFIRYKSGARDGQYGVELWISQVQPISFGDKETYLEPGDVTICHKDARRLLAHIEKADVELWIYVIHAPHSGRSEEEVSHWWTDTTEILKRRRKGGRVMVLGDCNAKTGASDGVHVFDNDDNEGKTTEAFRTFLEDAELCVPATGKGHIGEQTTWTTPNQEKEVRIDYVLVGCDQMNEVQLSQVVQEVDLGDLAIDHRPVGLQLEWWVDQGGGQDNSCGLQWPQDFDRQKVRDRTVLEELQKDLGEGTVAEWDVNIEDHVEDYTRQIHRTLRKHAYKERGAPKKPFIGPELWKLRSEKRASERCLKHTKRLIDREYLALYFQAWTARKTSRNCLNGWKVGAVRLAATLRHKGRQLRQGIRDAKNAYVNDIVGEITPQASASDILRGLRPVIGTSNMRKRKGQSLPQVRNQSGEICDNKKDAIDAWADYFTAMEGGERLQADEQRRKWVQGLEFFQQKEIELELRECPNLVEMEHAFRRIKDGKAVGLDGVIPEVCRRCSKELARMSYTQLLKLMCHGQEAMIHKGGTLAVAYKKGERDVCSSYRSLLVSSHQGKTIHRALHETEAMPSLCGLPAGSAVRRTP